jgi:hypothetical protein
MSFASRPGRSAALVTAALAVAGAGAALVADSGRAQDAGRTLTITYGKTAGAMNDIAPKGVGRGRASLGDQFFISAAIRRQDGARGRLQATYTVSEKKVRLDRSTGQITGLYRFADGAIIVAADATFDDVDTDHGAIVGGTGAYAGARGTMESGKTQDVLHLLP